MFVITKRSLIFIVSIIGVGIILGLFLSCDKKVETLSSLSRSNIIVIDAGHPRYFLTR